MVFLVFMVCIGPIFLEGGNTEFLDTGIFSFCVHFKQPDEKNQ